MAAVALKSNAGKQKSRTREPRTSLFSGLIRPIWPARKPSIMTKAIGTSALTITGSDDIWHPYAPFRPHDCVFDRRLFDKTALGYSPNGGWNRTVRVRGFHPQSLVWVGHVVERS